MGWPRSNRRLPDPKSEDFSAMPCPHCGTLPSKVRGMLRVVTLRGVELKRQRVCRNEACGKAFTTYESYGKFSHGGKRK